MPSRTLAPQEISDRLQIQDLLTRYTVAIDTKDWKRLDTCFTPDAEIDYTASGGVRGRYPEVRAWLEKALAALPMTQHFISNTTLELQGDRARARTYVLNPNGFRDSAGKLHIFTVGAYYNDKLTWTAEGWRIAERIEEAAFFDGAVPEGLKPVE